MQAHKITDKGIEVRIRKLVTGHAMLVQMPEVIAGGEGNVLSGVNAIYIEVAIGVSPVIRPSR